MYLTSVKDGIVIINHDGEKCEHCSKKVAQRDKVCINIITSLHNISLLICTNHCKVGCDENEIYAHDKNL